MKDGDTLKGHNVKDGLTVHLVIKAPQRSEPEQTIPRPAADVRQTPFGLNQLGGLAGLGALGAGSNTFMDLQAQMQNELMSNPDMIRTVLDNPLVQQMMDNPDTMRTLLTANPQMQELMQRNPEISHMLNNPELLRQTMELARNPSMLQELMRSHDRAMSNLESVPGGYSQLQRIYRDIQEPMLNAASESFSGNPFAGLVDNASGANPQLGSENRDPLPNPWAGRGGAGGNNQQNSTSNASGIPPNLLNTPSMQSLLQQMSDNPTLMQNMMNAPYTRTMMDAMQADPQMAASLINQSPLLANNPQMQEQMRTMMPQLIQQMQNPEIQSMMSNPQALDAIMQIQQGMERLRTAAPGLVNTFGIPPMPAGFTPNSAATTASTDTTTTNTNTSATAQQAAQANPALFSEFMARMMGGLASGANPNQPPEERYSTQLETLASMGFGNREANLQGK